MGILQDSRWLVESQELNGDSAMDRMKRILSSPITKKKGVGGGPRYFGVALDELVRREDSTVPTLITRVCNYIQENGMTSEGIFRVNGNSRVVEKLRTSFDTSGDADLEEAGDVMAVAGLLKLFLRELPDSAIPENMTQEFVTAQEECLHKKEECLQRLRVLLTKLPKVHYDLLKHLCRFLVLVSLQEQNNKMSPMALGIVFGPNVFRVRDEEKRCSNGIEGLRQQGTTNQVVLQFITKYDYLFLEEGEISPYNANCLQTRIQISGITTQESEEGGDDSTPRSIATSSTPRFSDDDFLDTARSASPFVLDSDRSDGASSVIASPMPSASNTDTLQEPPWMVEKAISSTISQHLFGDNSTSSEDSLLDKQSPVPAPRRKKKDKGESSPVSSPDSEEILPVKQRIQRFESKDDTGQDDASKPRKQRPKSKAFELFESQGIVIGPAPDSAIQCNAENGHEDGQLSPTESLSPSGSPGSSRPVPRPRAGKRKAAQGGSEGSLDEGIDMSSQDSVQQQAQDSDDSGFGTIQRASNTLTSFKRAPGPKNRRTPSRRTLRQQLSTEDNGEADLLDHIDEYDQNGDDDDDEGSPQRMVLNHRYDNVDAHEEVHINGKSSISFLNIHHNGNITAPSDDQKSPTASQKPYIPPLDLSILHEHGDGNEPIPAEQGPSWSIHKAKAFKEDDVMLSPRTSKIKKKSQLPVSEAPVSPSAHNSIEAQLSPRAYHISPSASANTDTNVAPSPPAQQNQVFFSGSNRIKEDQTFHSRQLTHKIQGSKKKLKQFEESFEMEHGYRPSHSDKAARPEVKKIMQELTKARKDLKRLKEELAQSSDRDPYYVDSSPGSSGHQDTPINEDGPPRIEDTLILLQRKLADKRREAKRPEDLVIMSREEVSEEKLAVQKALLQYESLHGRPTLKSEKEVMKPLYDRYRTIKRLMVKPMTPLDKGELQPVPEDGTIEFSASPPTSGKTSTQPSTPEVVRIPTASHSEDMLETDFMVTRLMRDTLQPVDENRPAPIEMSTESWKTNLHQMSIPQLLDEQNRSRSDKKRLRKVLREFEDDFYQQTGRKVQKEDRAPMETEYQEYKQIKARLKLLEALVSKHDAGY